MKVTCNTMHEFLFDLSAQIKEREGDASCVFQEVVRLSVSRLQVGEIKYEVHLQASAIVDLEEEGQYLLLVGVNCGYDYEGGEQDFAGTEKADEIRDEVENFCTRYGLTIRPGVVEE